ncbi:MAG: trypsin-like serine protease [Polyangiaceae bacterium]
MRTFAAGFGLLSLTLVAGCSGEKPLSDTETRNDAIVGGVVDNDANAHNNVIYLTSDQGACSGTLVASNLVLTAWHCVAPSASNGIGCDPNGASSNGDHVGDDFTPNRLRVHTGANPGSTVARGTQILHEAGKQLCNRDLAFVVLDTPITGITPAKIRTNYVAVPGETVTVVGYGITSNGGGGSGTRRRRDNVPILAAGKDWNELLATSEFQLGPSGCSGDSGGPAFDSTTGAVIGVSSRVGNCNVGPLIDTSLFGHDALVQAAFAAAGKTALLEGNPVPSPIKNKADGDDCTSGWECAGDICRRENTPGECTKFCSKGSTSSCPADMMCVPSSFDVDGQNVDSDLCVSIPNDGSCYSCRATNCRLRTQDCLANPDCVTIADCVDGCNADDEACVTACEDASPNGANAFNSLKNCTCLTDCKDVCNGCTAGTAGTGAGGASTGGSGAGGAGTGGAATGGASTGGTAGVGGGAAGTAGAMTGGSAGNGIAGAGGSADKQTSADAGSTSGCSISESGSAAGGSSGGRWFFGLGLGGLALLRRRRR